ncbi:unnamed protein product [Coffea canephora]|uniref:SUI1 domain-containing protein n=1 Tax=Coffea canephora TaxID=49390 RepID=A0A068US70_COFCA|nr:unnamed protein product [Coffea canephora]
MSEFDLQTPAAFDPFAEANADNSSAGSKDYVHICIQQRNGRKSLTTVQGLKKEFSSQLRERGRGVAGEGEGERKSEKAKKNKNQLQSSSSGVGVRGGGERRGREGEGGGEGKGPENFPMA